MRKWFGLFALFLIHCSSQEETPCSYKSTPQTTLSPSEIPARMKLPLDQQKLIALMWVPEEQCSCYLSKNGAVKSYKINDSRYKKAPDTFPHLATPSASGLQEWQESQDEVGGHLLGLTVFGFQPQADTIVYTRIYVRSDGPLWSLWHEYAHFLIGQVRATSPELTLPRVRQQAVHDSLQKVLTQEKKSESSEQELTTAWNNYSRLEMQFIRKKFGDEILIEALLLDYAHQAGDLLKISSEETLNAARLIDDFYIDFLQYRAATRARLQLLKNTSSEVLRIQIDAHLERIEEFNSQVKEIYQYSGLLLPI